MLSIVLSTFAFFLASYFLKRWLEDMGVPKGMTQGVLVFSIALLIAYFVGWIVDRLAQ